MQLCLAGRLLRVILFIEVPALSCELFYKILRGDGFIVVDTTYGVCNESCHRDNMSLLAILVERYGIGENHFGHTAVGYFFRCRIAHDGV